ncbi:hypothetical protein [Tenacibaculum retecalamus]|uniref:hypothetical protein n=1 Tax=Tenacibaculum retecalamus TaxID=3018315 RepID=UPI0023D9666C|nr:hypothetical protein [Tenacibaculum retecalamus]WBX71828.1 hypothetical protein PG912_03335 [Tenacibaculum retecalamus]
MGSVSNADGKIKIPLKNNRIVVSHINYIESEFGFEDYKKKDTLFLIPKANQLEEVVLYNLDLKQKFTDILKNSYFDKYSKKKITHSATYKETFSVNNSLTRLFQIQLDWYSKNSLFKRDIAIDKQNTVNLETIDFSKKSKIEKNLINSNSGYVENKTFFKFLHLNFLLETLIYLTNDYEIESIEKNKNTINVYFNATLIEKDKKVFEHKNSLIVFEKDYKSIKSLKLNMIYSKGFEEALTNIDKIPHKKKTKSHVVNLSFKKLRNNKYSINYFISELKGIIKTKKYTDTIISTQSLFINESRLGKKIKRGNFDFNKPFYENIPNNLKKTSEKILLTEKEKDFLKS